MVRSSWLMVCHFLYEADTDSSHRLIIIALTGAIEL